MKIILQGKAWDFRYSRGLRNDGHCDNPETPRKKIRVKSGLPDPYRLEVIIHELLHASLWAGDESWVDDTAHDIAAVLAKLGYRRTE